MANHLRGITAGFLLLGVLFCVHDSQQRTLWPKLLCDPDGLCRIIPGQNLHFDDTIRFPGPSVMFPPPSGSAVDTSKPSKGPTFDENIRFPGPLVLAPNPHVERMSILRWPSLDTFGEEKTGEEVGDLPRFTEINHNSIKNCPPGKRPGHGGICREVEE